MTISQRITELRNSIPPEVRIVAVSKTKPVPAILEAYNAGQRLFGENRVQELISKQPLLPSDIEWHFIGHLQSNKVRLIAPFIGLIHSIDSLNLLKEVNREAVRNEKVIDCLLQFFIATEETKYGFDLPEVRTVLESDTFHDLVNIRITGVMGMASFSDDMSVVRSEFRRLREYFTILKNDYFAGSDSFRELSMGMSGDYPIAIEEGSTMIRIGTSLFGER